MDDIFGPGRAPGQVTEPDLEPDLEPDPEPDPEPAPAPAIEPTSPPMRGPARSSRSLQTYASLVLGLLASGFAIFAIWLAIDQLMR